VPVGFLSPSQRDRYGRYPDTLSADDLARYFYLADDDLENILIRRGDRNRLGFALQLTTVRYLGTFLERPVDDVPHEVKATLAAQLKITDAHSLQGYQASRQHHRHAVEIRERYGYREFTEPPVGFRLARWLCALCWTGTERPSVLFERATAWLLTHKVLLPGVTTLERFIAQVRSRMETRLWRLLSQGVSAEQQAKLEALLAVAEGSRQSWLDKLRKGPVRVSGPALVQALRRVETVRELGITLPAAAHIPRSRLASLARFAGTVKVTVLDRLPPARKLATLAAFVHSMEAAAQDDALDVLDMLLRELFSKAEHADRRARLRSLKDLDQAATTLAEACKLMLNPDVPDSSLRERIYDAIGRDVLTQALDDISALVRPPDDVFYQELSKKHITVARFLPTLLRVLRFKAGPAGEPLVAALEWLHHRPDHEPPDSIVDKAWKRYMVKDNGEPDHAAFAFCVLDHLKTALRRRDVFVSPSWRYADPRAGLLNGAEWETARPVVCRALGLSADPKPALEAIATELDQAYRDVAARLPANTAVRIETVAGKHDLVLSPLDKLDEPPSLKALRHAVKARMPQVDLPDIVMEIAARTGFTEAFTHVAERPARAADLTTSLCAVLLSQACNTGPEPFVRPDASALRRDRLMWVDQNYVREDTLAAANSMLVAAQNRIALARAWGGGEVASADGLRFVVPVRTVHAAPNPKYFNRERGVTWYNLISDQASGLNAITVPGTLRDSLVLLGVLLEQQTELQPTRIMTDTGAYSDVVFGLFRLLGYRFSPRLADIGGTRFWRIDANTDYGELNKLARQRVILRRIEPHWDDFLRLAGSLKLGRVPASGIMRMLQAGDRMTQLAQALAEFGRIDKTIHSLRYIDDEAHRRDTLIQLNLGERRHQLARALFHGKRGELHQQYREGQEDQLGALGLTLNVIVLWNTIYMDAVLAQLRSEGFPVHDGDVARLDPLGFDHINMLGRYSFAVHEAVARGELRPLRDPREGGPEIP
jgi:TnpA family transposase